ncbi:MAG: T9SS type A sorting domain-containing protein [Actinobacteria bacterium]|nr:T9SS type A sorting domain-containing protein [Actinomycetota bacterium]
MHPNIKYIFNIYWFFIIVLAVPRITDAHFSIGVDNGGDSQVLTDAWFNALDTLGVEFVVFHYAPNRAYTGIEQSDWIADFSRKMADHQIEYVLNFELANWLYSWIDADNWDWCAGPNGTHRWNFKPEVLQTVAQSGQCIGVMFDEAGHMQINNNWVWKNRQKLRLPFLADCQSFSLQQAYQATVDTIQQITRFYKQSGISRVLTEDVFPIMFHNFARGGMLPAPKILKETFTPIAAAMSLGASLEYHLPELWITPDLWKYGDYPGHSATELFSALKFAFWIGADRIYVENMNYGNTENGLIYFDDENNIHLGKHGQMMRQFAKEYVPNQLRTFSWRDFSPSVAIIRFPDTDGGQAASSFWPDELYGSSELHSTPTTRNWFKIWHLLSHGVIPKSGLNLNYVPVPFQFLVPINNVVVFDHLVTADMLASTKCIFLTGIKISESTMKAVINQSKKGTLVISPPHLAPSHDTENWLITDDVLSDEVKRKVAPFLGAPDEMRYVFGNREVIFKPIAGNYNNVQVIVQNNTKVATRQSSTFTTDSIFVYPNPFNSSASIQFRLAAPGIVNLNVYNLNGQLVRNILNKYMSAADYEIAWDGKDQSGLVVSSGVYFIILAVNDKHVAIQKITFIQ